MMNKARILIIGLSLISLCAWGQEDIKVEKYQGHGIFKSQKVLDLSYENLKVLPPIPANQEVEVLILDNNNIEELPRWIGNLKNLKVLSVRNNKLQELNFSLSRCDSLEQIYLSGNKDLSEMPNLSMCEKLQIIDVVGTKINEVPAWVNSMENMLYFKFSKKETINRITGR